MRARVGIVGAGVAGLAAARALVDAGVSVTVYEKSRGLGGRLARRRLDGFDFDLGAPSFASTEPDLARRSEPWGRSGQRVATPTMNALAHSLAEGIEVRTSTRVESLRNLNHEFLIVAVPAPQAANLLAEAPDLAQVAASVGMDPCWVVLLTYTRPLESLDPVLAPLDACYRESAKPGRNETPERWTLHATADWSRRHVDDSPESVIDALRGAFESLSRSSAPRLVAADAHRWSLARASRPAGRPFFWDPVLRIGVCGDWCQGNSVDAAYRSGTALAARVLESARDGAPNASGKWLT